MLLTRLAASILPAGLLCVTTGLSHAQDFPNKPIRLIVAAPGGGSDFTARQLAAGLGQQIIVDYRGGGFQSIDYVQKSPPDGYTLHLTGSTLWVLPLVNKQVPYDAEKDFIPITSSVRLIVEQHQLVGGGWRNDCGGIGLQGA